MFGINHKQPMAQGQLVKGVRGPLARTSAASPRATRSACVTAPIVNQVTPTLHASMLATTAIGAASRVSYLFATGERGHAVALHLLRWVGGLSLSSVALLILAFLTTIVLRGKGYGVRLGLACLVFYARPGSRRFPDGCRVRVSTRVVGFLFGGCRGPWLDVYAERFYMRLRPTVLSPSSTISGLPSPVRRLIDFLRIYIYSTGIAAVDHGYWATLFRNVVVRIIAFVIRGLRVRVEKLRLWKDAGSWEVKAEQLVLAGRAAGVFGSRYSLSVNELYVNVCKTPREDVPPYVPIHANLVLRRGVEISAFLTPRFFTLLQPRRMAIMDDLKIKINVHDISCAAPKVLDASLAQFAMELCPGYSRGLKAKLPPSAPIAERPRRPGILRYWEGNCSITSLAVRFAAPFSDRNAGDDTGSLSLPPSVAESFRRRPSTSDIYCGAKNGVFMRVEYAKVDAYGKAADERHEAMTRATINVRGCSAGSAAVDVLSHALYESVSSSSEGSSSHSRDGRQQCKGGVESVENIDKIVASKPELLVWIEDATAGLDVNCSRRHSMRVETAGNGGIFAIEPVGLVRLAEDLRIFISKYVVLYRAKDHFTSSSETKALSPPPTPSDCSLQSPSAETSSLRLVCDFRHLAAVVLGHGPVGDGDTVAIVVSARTVAIQQADLLSGSGIRFAGSVTDFTLMHWSQWAQTTNVMCQKAVLDFHRGETDRKSLVCKQLIVDWDLDMQSGLESLPEVLAVLKHLKHTSPQKTRFEMGGIRAAEASSQLSPGPDLDRAPLTEGEGRERRERKRRKLLRSLDTWELQGVDVSVTASFPDGPKLGLSVGELPTCKLSTETFFGRNLVFTLRDRKCAYCAEFRMGSPLHTMNRTVEKRRIAIEVQGLRFIMWHDFPFGYLLQDWLLRLRSVIRISRETKLRRHGIPLQKAKRKPLPDIYFVSSDVEIYFEDHPIGAFLTRMLPLYQDETRERLVREQLMSVRIQQLQRIARAEIAGTSQRCEDALRKKDSEVWTERVRKLKLANPPVKIGDGHLPDFEFAPVARLVAAGVSFNVVMDDLVREHGSAESIRHLKMLDDYELGGKKENKTRQHDSDAWNSIGFRMLDLEGAGVRLRFRDYKDAFVVIDRMYFDKAVIGHAVQATVHPYLAETTVAIGRRRVVKVVKGLAPAKMFVDAHLVIETLQCGYNPSFLGAIGDFAKGIGRFFGGGKNPSPRLPWFDSLRVNMHGRMRITAKKLSGHLTSSISPYSMTKHYVEVDVDNFEMLVSRLEATPEDTCPISWKLHNWRIRPSSFDENRKSEVVFDFVRVGLNPLISVDGGDSQDHYFVPFPSKEDILSGGPGIGRGDATLVFVEEPVQEEDNGFGNFTEWATGLHGIPNFDSFKNFKTRSMILGIDVCVRHAESRRDHFSRDLDTGGLRAPSGASILHSDGITTLIKVVKKLVRRPVSCRLPPRRARLQRKPPSKTGMSSSLAGLNVFVDVQNLNMMLYNNLEPGHGLFISVASIVGELWKRTDIRVMKGREVRRSSRLTRRRFKIRDIYSSIRVPGLDMAVDGNDTGKLLTVDKISLSDNLQGERSSIASPSSRGVSTEPVSGFGNEDLDKSPFYTFSATNPLQRGKRLDKVVYDKRLLVDRVRLIWSPVRRSSVFAWPDAFKEKLFCMKGPRVELADHVQAEPEENQAFSPQVTTPEVLPGHRENPSAPSGPNTRAELLGDDGAEVPILDLAESKLHQSVHKLTSSYENSASNTKTELVHRREPLIPNQNVDSDAWPSGTGTTTPNLNHDDPLSPPLVSTSRVRTTHARRPTGSMVDLLSPFQEHSRTEYNEVGEVCDGLHSAPDVEVLRTTPKFVLFISDCQVSFGSPETSGYVFLTSNAVTAGIVDKTLQKSMQLGKANERWSSREYRVHLNSANLYTRSKSHGDFDFSTKDWVSYDGSHTGSLALVTRNPISMDLMYVSSSSIPGENGHEAEEDHILRPALLFINIPDICLSTNADEFHAAVDVVRRVLMQSMRSAELVNEELTNLRYKLQLAGGKVSSDELGDFMRRLNNITKQFLYSCETFQEDLVDSLFLSDEGSFANTLLRYKAKAKAVATFMRQDQRAISTDVLYPTMYVSYSFDKLSWELREKAKEVNKDTEHPFVEISLEDLVCRHIFYVGRGSSTEITFGNISAENKIKSSYFQGILQPAATATTVGPGGFGRRKSRIKASDGAPVAFRWYSTQEDRVGGIPVYELLTIQVAPMTAAVTRKLYSSVSGFIFSARSKPGPSEANESQDASRPNPSQMPPVVATDSRTSQAGGSAVAGRKPVAGQGLSVSSRPSTAGTTLDDVSQMARRGESSILFKYVFIDAFELTASFKNKENAARGVLDFFDLFVTTPSFSYSSQVWTWKAFSVQIRKDLVMTFARRGVSNLAKIKLLPGYSRAKRRLQQGADTFRESIYSRLPSASNPLEDDSKQISKDPKAHDVADEGLMTAGVSADRSQVDEYSSTEQEEEDVGTAIEEAFADISPVDDRWSGTVLKALYGTTSAGSKSRASSRHILSSGFSRSRPGSDGSGESTDSGRQRVRGGLGVKPPMPPSHIGTASTPSRDSQDEELPSVPSARASLFRRMRKRAHNLRTDADV